jgi:hypothetical protein
MSAYRLTLYKQIDTVWHYCQMTANDAGKLITVFGKCGDAPEQRTEILLPADADPFNALQEAGTQWRLQGFDYPRRKDMQIMSLHFRVANMSGWPAGAPWFEDWKTYYQEPVDNLLTTTANGFANGSHRLRGHYLLYYYVLDTAAARATVEAVVAAAPVRIPLEIHISDRELRPEIQMADGVPSPLADLYKGFEEVALTIAEASQNIVFQSVTLTPQVVHESSRQRVRGLDAQVLRLALRERWGFTCNYWPPLGGEAKSEVVYLSALDPTLEQPVLDLLKEKIQAPVYLLDCEEGIFKISPENIFRGAYEGVVFDDGLEWIIYFSHHNTITFGGDWLIEAVNNHYKDQPALLNRW